MKNPELYKPEYDQLNAEEQHLLERCLKSVEKFVEQSAKISKVDYATRDAHSKTYAVMKGTLTMDDELPNFIRNVFSQKNYNVILRLSHANPVINQSPKEVPAYGFALKIKGILGKDANFPLVNFPIFPEKSVANFLRFFTSLNTFLYTKQDNFVVSAMDVPFLLKHGAKLMPGMFTWTSLKNINQILKKKKDFILSFNYFSIGVYRMGDNMVKIRAVPVNPMPKYAFGLKENQRIKNFLQQHPVQYVLQAQICENLHDQPVNDLSKEWKNATFWDLGFLEFSKDGYFDENYTGNENLGFSPFENPDELLPVGKLQQTRKKVYETSIQKRNQLNGFTKL